MIETKTTHEIWDYHDEQLCNPDMESKEIINPRCFEKWVRVSDIKPIITLLKFVEEYTEYFDQFCDCGCKEIVGQTSHDNDCMTMKFRKDYDKLNIELSQSNPNNESRSSEEGNDRLSNPDETRDVGSSYAQERELSGRDTFYCKNCSHRLIYNRGRKKWYHYCDGSIDCRACSFDEARRCKRPEPKEERRDTLIHKRVV